MPDEDQFARSHRGTLAGQASRGAAATTTSRCWCRPRARRRSAAGTPPIRIGRAGRARGDPRRCARLSARGARDAGTRRHAARRGARQRLDRRARRIAGVRREDGSAARPRRLEGHVGRGACSLATGWSAWSRQCPPTSLTARLRATRADLLFDDRRGRRLARATRRCELAEQCRRCRVCRRTAARRPLGRRARALCPRGGRRRCAASIDVGLAVGGVAERRTPALAACSPRSASRRGRTRGRPTDQHDAPMGTCSASSMSRRSSAAVREFVYARHARGAGAPGPADGRSGRDAAARAHRRRRRRRQIDLAQADCSRAPPTAGNVPVLGVACAACRPTRR